MTTATDIARLREKLNSSNGVPVDVVRLKASELKYLLGRLQKAEEENEGLKQHLKRHGIGAP